MLLSERKYDSAQEVQSINRILVPALVFLIQDIIELRPHFEVLHHLEFNSGIQVERSLEISSS